MGVHGLTIEFTDKGKTYSATYLPDVALEQGEWVDDGFSLGAASAMMPSRFMSCVDTAAQRFNIQQDVHFLIPTCLHDTGWDHDECVDSLIRKAGYRGYVDSTVRGSLKVTRYQSSKADQTFQEYLQTRAHNAKILESLAISGVRTRSRVT